MIPDRLQAARGRSGRLRRELERFEFGRFELGRRRLLRGTAWAVAYAGTAGLAVGCDLLNATPRPAVTPKPDPDLPVVVAALATTDGLLAQYDATIRTHPRLRESLHAYAGRHREHRTALADGSAGPKPPQKGSPSPAAGSRGSPGSSDTSDGPGSPDRPGAAEVPPSGTSEADRTHKAEQAVPRSEREAVRTLLVMEKEAATGRSHALESARNPELARLLASIGACETLHAILLADVAGEAGE